MVGIQALMNEDLFDALNSDESYINTQVGLLVCVCVCVGEGEGVCVGDEGVCGRGRVCVCV